MAHKRLRPFNTRKTYPEQNLDNDLAQGARLGSRTGVLALYTRRGGLDINPWRSSRQASAPRLRSPRQ